MFSSRFGWQEPRLQPLTLISGAGRAATILRE
jgi:hypothetical protein